MAKNLKANASATASSKTQFVGTAGGYETVTVKTAGFGSTIDKNIEKIIFNAKASSMTYKIDDTTDTVSFFDKSKKLVVEISIDDNAQVVFNDKIINFANDTVKNKISASATNNQHITLNLDSALNAYKSTILPAFDKAIAEISKYIPSFNNLIYKIEKADLNGNIATGECIGVWSGDVKNELPIAVQKTDSVPAIQYKMMTGKRYDNFKYDYDAKISVDISKLKSIDYTTVEHEILHTMGFGINFSSSSTTFSILTEQENNNYYFVGENAIKVNNGNVFLTDDRSHVDIKNDLMYPYDYSQTLSKLDLAVISDMGINVVGVNFNNNESLI